MRKPNRFGCMPREDVCMMHHLPLECRHGCKKLPMSHHCKQLEEREAAEANDAQPEEIKERVESSYCERTSGGCEWPHCECELALKGLRATHSAVGAIPLERALEIVKSAFSQKEIDPKHYALDALQAAASAPQSASSPSAAVTRVVDTPRCDALESNALDSFDYRAWGSLARQLERELSVANENRRLQANAIRQYELQSASVTLDAARLDFLADITNLSALGDFGSMLTGEQIKKIDRATKALSVRYEFHRRTNDTPAAFRLAVDEAMSDSPDRRSD